MTFYRLVAACTHNINVLSAKNLTFLPLESFSTIKLTLGSKTRHLKNKKGPIYLSSRFSLKPYMEPTIIKTMWYVANNTMYKHILISIIILKNYVIISYYEYLFSIHLWLKSSAYKTKKNVIVIYDKLLLMTRIN